MAANERLARTCRGRYRYWSAGLCVGCLWGLGNSAFHMGLLRFSAENAPEVQPYRTKAQLVPSSPWTQLCKASCRWPHTDHQHACIVDGESFAHSLWLRPGFRCLLRWKQQNCSKAEIPNLQTQTSLWRVSCCCLTRPGPFF